MGDEPAVVGHMIYDVARQFAQALGIHLQEWEDGIIETDKSVRLLSVAERAMQLLGEEGADAMGGHLELKPRTTPQLTLSPDANSACPKFRGRGHRRHVESNARDTVFETRREATTLDRVHAAMLLQRVGRANALRALLSAERDLGPDFLRLANALPVLYPKESEEKRLFDAMLLVVAR